MMIKYIEILPVIMFCYSCSSDRSIADDAFNVSVSAPQFKTLQPKVTFDESHKVHHRISKTYKPLAALLTNDGCIVSANDKAIDQSVMETADIYVIVTAMGKEDPGDISPFTDAEVSTLTDWVSSGGSLLLVTEDYPFGLAMQPLLSKFGIDVHNGYTEDSLLASKDVKDALLFEKSKGNLNSMHPICQDIKRVYTFTGSAVKGDSSCIPLLLFSSASQNFNVKVNVMKSGSDILTSVEYADFYSAQGFCQGLCKQYEKGKIVVLAESALLTAQIDKNGNKFGMNVPENDNKQFALNIFRWLAAK